MDPALLMPASPTASRQPRSIAITSELSKAEHEALAALADHPGLAVLEKIFTARYNQVLATLLEADATDDCEVLRNVTRLQILRLEQLDLAYYPRESLRLLNEEPQNDQR